MQTKLTLRLEEDLIEQAKLIAKQSGKSVSQMVADYFAAMSVRAVVEKGLPPITASLQGCLAQEIIDDKQDYRDYLEQKYL
jgi:hypothetical protein